MTKAYTAALCLAAAINVIAQTPDPYHRDVTVIHRNTVELENSWYRLLHDAHGPRQPVLWRITLTKAIVDRDVTIEILDSPVIGVWARAWAPKLCRSVHPVEITQPITIDNGKPAMDFKTTLDLRDDRLWRDAMDGLPQIPAEIHVKGKMEGSTFTGTYVLKPAQFPPVSETEPGPNNPLAAAQGRATGIRSAVTQTLKANPAHWAPRTQEEPGSLYVLGMLLEEKADDWYQRIRAIEGDRIYIRGYYGATCVGYTGDEGRRYEAVTVARNLLDDIYSDLPGKAQLHEPAMAESSVLKTWPYQHPRNIHGAPLNCLVLSGQAPHRWWMLGPVPSAAAGKTFAAFGGGASRTSKRLSTPRLPAPLPPAPGASSPRSDPTATEPAIHP